MRDVQALLKAWDSVERLRPVHQKYITIGWKSKKEKYYQEHKAEIDEYNKAYRLLKKFYPDKKVPVDSLNAELKKLPDEMETLRPELDKVKADLEELRFIRCCVASLEEKPERAENGVKESVINRLHEQQQIVDERKQNNNSRNHSIEKEI